MLALLLIEAQTFSDKMMSDIKCNKLLLNRQAQTSSDKLMSDIKCNKLLVNRQNTGI